LNATIRHFGHPSTLIAELEHWVVLLRPSQPTLGSLILAAKGEATTLSQIPADGFRELREVVSSIERMLMRAVDYRKLNYLMLMMQDPHVHFHVLPRYETERSAHGITVTDNGWPGPPTLGQAVALGDAEITKMTGWLKAIWD
jgi:diadenosine tetraphosphate (Ap4A) HIT family hydrolase